MKNNTRYLRFPINITNKEGEKIHIERVPGVRKSLYKLTVNDGQFNYTTSDFDDCLSKSHMSIDDLHVQLNKTRLRSIVKESVKRALRESQELEFDDDGFPKNIPEDVVEWGVKCQHLGLELSILCGKYRFENNDLYEMLRTLDDELNAVNGDLNTFGIAPHYDR